MGEIVRMTILYFPNQPTGSSAAVSLSLPNCLEQGGDNPINRDACQAP